MQWTHTHTHGGVRGILFYGEGFFFFILNWSQTHEEPVNFFYLIHVFPPNREKKKLNKSRIFCGWQPIAGISENAVLGLLMIINKGAPVI